MKLAVMQPYLFPYLGYYQLMDAADHFVVLDDVAFIKQGWINRNQILASGKPQRFTIPVRGAGSHVEIRAVSVDASRYSAWRAKFFKTLDQSYRRAPHFDPVMNLVASVLPREAGGLTIRDLAVASLDAVMAYLRRDHVRTSSSEYDTGDLRATARVLELCRQLGATQYCNAPGGRGLYRPEAFERHGIELVFLEPRPVQYRQHAHPFVGGLSIIDVLMFNSREETVQLLGEYDLS